MPSRLTNSDRSWEIAKGWMEECTTSHDECRQTIMEGGLPTRLVYIGNNPSEARLCLSEELEHNVLYLTFNTKPFITLTRNSFDEFRRRIPFDRLSKTFQDAMSSTRALGFHYIWVDSLFIIQNDREDLSKEASTMGAVYANSSLTLAAVDFADGDSGKSTSLKQSVSH